MERNVISCRQQLGERKCQFPVGALGRQQRKWDKGPKTRGAWERDKSAVAGAVDSGLRSHVSLHGCSALPRALGILFKTPETLAEGSHFLGHQKRLRCTSTSELASMSGGGSLKLGYVL